MPQYRRKNEPLDEETLDDIRYHIATVQINGRHIKDSMEEWKRLKERNSGLKRTEKYLLRQMKELHGALDMLERIITKDGKQHE